MAMVITSIALGFHGLGRGFLYLPGRLSDRSILYVGCLLASRKILICAAKTFAFVHSYYS